MIYICQPLNLYADQNLSKQNLHAINIPLGKVNIKRKVNDLTIIVRFILPRNQ